MTVCNLKRVRRFIVFPEILRLCAFWKGFSGFLSPIPKSVDGKGPSAMCTCPLKVMCDTAGISSLSFPMLVVRSCGVAHILAKHCTRNMAIFLPLRCEREQIQIWGRMPYLLLFLGLCSCYLKRVQHFCIFWAALSCWAVPRKKEKHRNCLVFLHEALGWRGMKLWASRMFGIS